MPDWSTLNQKTASFKTEPSAPTDDITIVGLQFTLDQINSFVPAGGSPSNSMTIYADTLTLGGQDTIKTDNLIVVARSVELSPPVGSAQGIVQLPGTSAVLLVGEVTGASSLGLKVGAGSPATVATGMPSTTEEVPVMTASGAGPSQPAADNFGGSDAFDSLQASFTAATYLLTSDKPTAYSMLRWVTDATSTYLSSPLAANDPYHSRYADLYNQAAALLVIANAGGGATYVPILQKGLYETSLSGLATALQDFKTDLQTIQTLRGNTDALSQLASTLGDNTQATTAPLTAQSTQLTTNITNLMNNVQSLQQQTQVDASQANVAYNTLKIQLTQNNNPWVNFFKDGFKAFTDAVSSGFAFANLEEDPAGILPALQDGARALQGAATSIGDLTSPTGFPADAADLPSVAQTLLDQQHQIVTSFYNAVHAYTESSGGGTLPTFTADPDVAWDDFITKATSVLQDSQMDSVRDLANGYLASLTLLANDGKAINSQLVNLSAQMARKAVVTAQQQAAVDVETNLNILISKYQHRDQQLDALETYTKDMANNTKRWIFVAWREYAAAYYYAQLSDPPTSINLGMDAGQIQTAVSTGNFASAISSGGTVTLMQSTANFVWTFPIVQAGDQVKPGDAVFTPKSSGRTTPAVLSWRPDHSVNSVAGLVSTGTPIWVTGVKFFLQGVEAQDTDRVLGYLATSGIYLNAKTALDWRNDPVRFATAGVRAEYGYQPTTDGSTGQVKIAWTVASNIMNPTPFTTWTMTFDPNSIDPSAATKLKMKLTVIID